MTGAILEHFAHVFNSPFMVVTSACHCGNGGVKRAKMVSQKPRVKWLVHLH